jgi:protein-tyrosine phosphatase
MQQVFWLRPDLIAGRPGPGYYPWQPAELAAAGIGAILTVNDAQSVYPDDLAAAGIDHAWLPMEDNAPPRPGDFEHCLATLPQALDFIRDMHRQDRAVLIHCTAGKDRTGLTMAYYLCREEGYRPEAAIAEVRRVRPQALSALDYEPFAIEVLRALG